MQFRCHAPVNGDVELASPGGGTRGALQAKTKDTRAELLDAGSVDLSASNTASELLG